MQDPAWDMVKFVRLVAGNHRVARIRSALITNHQVELGGEQID